MPIHDLGPYPFEVPDFLEFPVRNKPPLHAVNVIVAHRITFDFTIILDQGDDDTRREIAAAFADGLQGHHTIEPYSLHGNEFELHRFTEMAGLDDAIAEHYLGFAYGDLVHVGFIHPHAHDETDRLRLLALTMMNGAIVRRGMALHP